MTPAPLPSPETEETEADETAAANVAPAPVIESGPEDGLDANEIVVIAGQTGLRDGMAITVTSEAEAKSSVASKDDPATVTDTVI